jgi:5-methylcytosine-specific restriction enzyme subunit McrC
MTLKKRPLERSVNLSVELAEWERVGPEQSAQLRGTSFAGDPAAQMLVRRLRERVDIYEGYQGLEISSTSYVGRIDIGSLRISIQPKLPALPLATLLRYAYGLRDVGILPETQAPLERHAFHDLLIALLLAEVEELIHRGLARRYVPLIQPLDSPRGQILVTQLARRGGLREARLPCRHFDRRLNWHLNYVLRAGLEIASKMAGDPDLRRHSLRIANSLEEVERHSPLDDTDLDRAERELTRLTASYAPALTIIRLLHSMLGVSFDAGEVHGRMPGFLFDMNSFFERLLSRFLDDNLEEGVLNQWPIRGVFAFAVNGNPKPRRAPTIRPDFALFRSGEPTFLDAKYRDVWDLGLPPGWLYQLSIYAMASPNRKSVLLYATTSLEASDERIEVNQPVSRSQPPFATVIVRPVPLQRLAELVDPASARKLTIERRRLAQALVAS